MRGNLVKSVRRMLSLHHNLESNACYWEGWQAVELKKQCTYTEAGDRRDWAIGFGDAVSYEIRGKMWYQSRTLVVGLIMLAAGVGMIIFGLSTPANGATVGIGCGVSTSSIIMSALRLITNTEVNFRDHDKDH